MLRVEKEYLPLEFKNIMGAIYACFVECPFTVSSLHHS